MTDLLAPEPPDPQKAVTPHPLSTEKAAQILTQMEKVLGGRSALLEALYAGPPNSALDYVVGAIADPRNDGRKLSAICAESGITLREFLRALRAGVLAPAITKAMFVVAAKVPEITEDLVNRSVVHEGDCPACQGRARIITILNGVQVAVPCLTCDGTGRATIQPDFEQQKFVLTTLAQMGPQKVPGVLIDQRDQSKHLSMDVSQQAHARLLGAVDKVLYGRRETIIDPPIDTTPIDAPPDSPDTPLPAED